MRPCFIFVVQVEGNLWLHRTGSDGDSSVKQTTCVDWCLLWRQGENTDVVDIENEGWRSVRWCHFENTRNAIFILYLDIVYGFTLFLLSNFVQIYVYKYIYININKYNINIFSQHLMLMWCFMLIFWLKRQIVTPRQSLQSLVLKNIFVKISKNQWYFRVKKKRLP